MPMYKSTTWVSDNYHLCPCIIGPLESQIITIYAQCISRPLEYQIITIYASVYVDHWSIR